MKTNHCQTRIYEQSYLRSFPARWEKAIVGKGVIAFHLRLTSAVVGLWMLSLATPPQPVYHLRCQMCREGFFSRGWRKRQGAGSGTAKGTTTKPKAKSPFWKKKKMREKCMTCPDRFVGVNVLNGHYSPCGSFSLLACCITASISTRNTPLPLWHRKWWRQIAITLLYK